MVRCLEDQKMTIWVDDEEVIFYIDKSMKYSPKQDDTLYYIDTIEPLVEENFQEIFKEDLFDTNFIGEEDMNMSNEEVLEELAYLIENDPSSRSNKEKSLKMVHEGNRRRLLKSLRFLSSRTFRNIWNTLFSKANQSYLLLYDPI
ncbi:hypothetical protein Tco_0719936 [Tanacetum coccineum]